MEMEMQTSFISLAHIKPKIVQFFILKFGRVERFKKTFLSANG